MEERSETWIFGYGSLVWRPAFAHRERRPAWIAGFARRFWQGSTDHRGTPGAPGRVVTLVREAEARCWGMAYRVEDDERAATLAAIDVRERAGYERLELPIHFEESGAPGSRALVWVATVGNRNYLGPTSEAAIAAQVRESRGPSGHNREYVLRLADALREIGAEDPHVFAVEEALRREG